MINAPTHTDDPYDSAMNAEYDPTRTYFGQIAIDVHHCVLIKGQGRVLFDPSQHKTADRRTAVGLDLTTLADGTREPLFIQRDFVAELDKGWSQVVKPSLRALGVDLRTLGGRWVQVQMVPTGKYTNKAGEEKTLTNFKFVAVYNTEQECRAAADAYFRVEPTPDTPAPASSTDDPEKETARRFLVPLWKSCNGDAEKFYGLIKSNPLLDKHFHSGSVEVVNLVFQKEPVPF